MEDIIAGVLNVEEIISELTGDYLDSGSKIEEDVVGFITEMVKRKMVVEA